MFNTESAKGGIGDSVVYPIGITPPVLSYDTQDSIGRHGMDYSGCTSDKHCCSVFVKTVKV